MQGKVPGKSMQQGDRHSALSLQALRNLFQVEELPVIARNYWFFSIKCSGTWQPISVRNWTKMQIYKMKLARAKHCFYIHNTGLVTVNYATATPTWVQRWN